MQRRRTSCSTGCARRITPTPGPPSPGTSKFPRPGGTPPCSRWYRSPAPGRRWPSWATRSRHLPQTRPRRPPGHRESPAHRKSPGHREAPGHQQATRRHRATGCSWTTRSAAWINGREIQFTFQEFELLAFLAAHPAIVFTRAELVERVWHRTLGQDGRPVPRDSRTVDVHVSRVRRKLGPRHGQCLVTEYRVGYQFRPRPA